MYKSVSMAVKAKTLAHEICHRIYHRDVTEIVPILFTDIREKSNYGACHIQMQPENELLSEPQMKIVIDDTHSSNIMEDENIDEFAINPWKDLRSKRPIYWLRWPIDLLLWSTIPDPRRHKAFFMLTFINCVIWIGILSYLIVYVTTDVGMLEMEFHSHIPVVRIEEKNQLFTRIFLVCLQIV